jgi:hypothetical protein
VHPDLRHENIGMTVEVGNEGGKKFSGNTGQRSVVTYSASMFCGQNEYEMGTWWMVFVGLDEPYRKQ